MSYISIDKLMPLLVKKIVSTDVIAETVREIFLLEDKINNLEQQSFYFQKGLKYHTKRLSNLKTAHEKYMALINGHTVDDFISELNEAKEGFEKWEKQCRVRPSIVNLIAMEHFRSKNTELENLLYAKGRYKSLNPLEECLKDSQRLSVFFE